MHWRAFSIAIVVSALVLHARAQQPEGDPSNAATWYRAAYAEYKSVKFEMDVYEHSAAFEADPDRGPDAIARKYVRQYREVVNLARRAARREHCDFGSYDPLGETGPTLEISATRELSRRLRDDFMVRVFDGDVDAAVENVCDIIRISRHAARHRAVIAPLVGAALLSMADRLISHATDRGLIGPGEATRLLRELNELKGDDPYDMVKTTAAGHVSMIESMRRRFTGEEGVRRFVEYVLPYYQQRGDADAIKALDAMNPQEIEKIIERLDALGRRHIAAMESRDDAAVATLEEEQKRGEHDRFAAMFIAEGKHVLKPMRDTQTLLKDRRAMLQGIIDGTIDPMSLANAACWYIRAGVKLEQIDAAALVLIDDHAAKRDPNAIAGKELIEVLEREDVREVFRMLETAAKIDKCDFSYAKPYWTEMYRPYHASLLACGRLLIADAMRRARAGDIDATTRRLAQVYQLSSRVASDGVVAGSLSAHRMFNDAETVAIALQNADRFKAKHLEVLRAAVSKFARADPFHYEPSLAAMRSVLAYWFMWFLDGAPEPLQPILDEARLEEARAHVAAIGADRLLALEAVCEEWQMHRAPPNNPVRAPIQGLWPIFDIGAFQQCREMIPTVKQWVAQGLTSQLGQAELPMIAPVEARMRQSVEDHRAAVRRLGVPAEPVGSP